MRAIAIGLFFFSLTIYAKENSIQSLANTFDSAQYHPEELGLNSFSVDVDIPELSQELMEKTNEKISFSLSWKAPDLVTIQMKGKAFENSEVVLEEMKKMVGNYLSFIIPTKISSVVKDHEVKSLGPKRFVIQDKNATRDYNEMMISFNGENILSQVIIKRPVGTENNQYQFFRESGLKGKWLLKELMSKQVMGSKFSESAKSIEYALTGGFYLPTQIKIRTKEWMTVPTAENGMDKMERESEMNVIFSGYKIN